MSRWGDEVGSDPGADAEKGVCRFNSLVLWGVLCDVWATVIRLVALGWDW